MTLPRSLAAAVGERTRPARELATSPPDRPAHGATATLFILGALDPLDDDAA
jgi:hypothetical protein